MKEDGDCDGKEVSISQDQVIQLHDSLTAQIISELSGSEEGRGTLDLIAFHLSKAALSEEVACHRFFSVLIHHFHKTVYVLFQPLIDLFSFTYSYTLIFIYSFLLLFIYNFLFLNFCFIRVAGGHVL